MDADTYQTLAARTLIDEPDTTFTNDELAIMLAALELGAAVGKVLEAVKKGICHRHGFDRYQVVQLLSGLNDAEQTFYSSISEPRTTPEYHLTGNAQMLIWCALGLGGEAGEVMEGASMLPYGRIRTAAMVKEQGDAAWYLAGIATLMGVSLSDVMQANIDKLKKRFEAGWSSEASIARVDVEIDTP